MTNLLSLFLNKILSFPTLLDLRYSIRIPNDITAKMTDSQVLVFEYESTIDEEMPKIRDFINENFTKPVLLLTLVDYLTTLMKSKNYNGAEVNLSYKGVHLLTLKPLHKNEDCEMYRIDINDDGKLLSWKDWMLLGACSLTVSLVVANLYGFFTAPTWVMNLVAATPALLAWTL
jgi:hypothetical protein